MHAPPSPLVENYLREADFWHVATVGRGCKLYPKLISALIERWRPETHIFHLPCEECTITLEDVSLQLGLPVDGYPVTGSAQSSDWEAICYELLGAIPEKMEGAGEFSWGLPSWQRYIERCAGRRDREEQKSEVACHYCGTIRQVMLDYRPLLKIYGFYWTNGRKHNFNGHHTRIRQFGQ
ncbi:hypothetical protein Gotur_028718 [Gossypium turneri]